MMQIRPANERGGADHGWLKSQHSFSFADYYHPEHMGFSSLRVINEDRIQGGSGFPPHAHRDMEIVTVVLEGALEHQDSMGNRSVIRPGEVQRMSAGTGIRHSEYNSLSDEETHFYQIWILPERAGIQPSYEQKSFAGALEKQNWVLALSQDGRDGSLTIHQDARVWLGRLEPGEKSRRDLDPRRSVWVQVIEGELRIEGQKFQAGDGAAMTNIESLELSSQEGARVILFDLP